MPRYRSAVTGKTVTKEFADKNPATTIKEKTMPKKKKAAEVKEVEKVEQIAEESPVPELDLENESKHLKRETAEVETLFGEMIAVFTTKAQDLIDRAYRLADTATNPNVCAEMREQIAEFNKTLRHLA